MCKMQKTQILVEWKVKDAFCLAIMGCCNLWFNLFGSTSQILACSNFPYRLFPAKKQNKNKPYGVQGMLIF